MAVALSNASLATLTSGGAVSLSIEQLFRAHVDDVYRIVAHLLGPGGSRADVEDLTQQVFLAAHKALPRYRGDAKPTTWLYGIATRVVLGWLRKRASQRRLIDSLQQLPQQLSYEQTPERLTQSRQELLQIWHALMKIKPKKRAVFVLFEVEGLSGAEIAQALEIPEATVWTRLHHARKELDRALCRREVAV